MCSKEVLGDNFNFGFFPYNFILIHIEKVMLLESSQHRYSMPLMQYALVFHLIN